MVEHLDIILKRSIDNIYLLPILLLSSRMPQFSRHSDQLSIILTSRGKEQIEAFEDRMGVLDTPKLFILRGW